MNILISVLLIASSFLVLAAPAPKIKVGDFQRLSGAQWTGVLTYLDYGKNKKVSIPSRLVVTRSTTDQRSWVFEYQYPDEPQANSKENVLIGKDGRSLANSYYSIDGGAAQTYTGAFTVSTPGTHTILFWSMDQANNTEAQRSLSFKLDSGAPLITIAASPSSAPKRNTPVSVTISGSVTDTPSGVTPNSATYAVVDEYGVKQPTGPVVLQSNGSYSFQLSLPATRNNKDSDGHKYTITVRANDQAGNSGAASTVLTIL